MDDLYGVYTDPKTRQKTPIGRRLLMARRLVEAGVRFVTVTYGEFDSHVRIKDDCKSYLPAFDHAVAGLITDLEQRGLLESTLVLVTTEFGRTPKINNTDGRDHWARVIRSPWPAVGSPKGTSTARPTPRPPSPPATRSRSKTSCSRSTTSSGSTPTSD